jgi:hypothetical protein
MLSYSSICMIIATDKGYFLRRGLQEIGKTSKGYRRHRVADRKAPNIPQYLLPPLHLGPIKEIDVALF